jgi:hypothetical protein
VEPGKTAGIEPEPAPDQDGQPALGREVEVVVADVGGVGDDQIRATVWRRRFELGEVANPDFEASRLPEFLGRAGEGGVELDSGGLGDPAWAERSRDAREERPRADRGVEEADWPGAGSQAAGVLGDRQGEAGGRGELAERVSLASGLAGVELGLLGLAVDLARLEVDLRLLQASCRREPRTRLRSSPNPWPRIHQVVRNVPTKKAPSARIIKGDMASLRARPGVRARS